MEVLFLKLFNMSITASWLILAVIFARFLLKKAPKNITVFMWVLVAFRLVCPFSFESILSLIPSAQTVPPNIVYSQQPVINSGLPYVNSVVNPIISESLAPNVTNSINPMQILIFIASILWAVGVVIMIIYTVVSGLIINRKVKESLYLKDNIWLCDKINTPFIFGVIKPKIYIPSDINENDMEYVLAHENAHLKRYDHWWKPLGFLILTVYWFNPLVWCAYILFCRDIELACDQKVIRQMGTAIKKDYSTALLNCSVSKKMISVCPLAFGEVGVKARIKTILNYKKPAFWVVMTAVILCVALAVAFLTNPKTVEWKSDNYTIHCNIISAECNDVVYEYMYGTLSADYPYICVNWTNNTKDELCFGQEFEIYKDGEIYKPVREMAFDDLLYGVKSGKSKSENHVLSSYNFEKGETYRLEKTFYLKSNPQQKYTAYISFSIDKIFSFVGKQYAGEKIVYENGSFSSIIYTDFNIPQFKISQQYMNLYKKDDTLDSSWKNIDGLQKIKLEKSNFDDLFTTEIWDDGYSASQIRKNNLNAFSSFDLNGTLYYLLEQKNGDIYIAQGNSVTSDFRWLFKMTQVDKTVAVGNTNSDSKNESFLSVSELKKKYPQFFNLSTDGGLTVYVWQMAENSYSCYLANTSMEAISDNSFAYEVGVTMEEMRRILTTYDIDRKDITIQPVSNPLSSYHYVIDDAYREKVEELFWLNENRNPTFEATVLEIYDNSVLVEPYGNGDGMASIDKVFVSTDLISTNEVPKFEKGMKIRVVYNGQVAESYPPQILGVFAIYEVE